MEYSPKFISLYLLLLAAYAAGGYFYYEKFIKKLYLEKGRLPAFAGYSQIFIFLIHALLIYLPYGIYGRWPEITVENHQFLIGLLVSGAGFVMLISGFVSLRIIPRIMGIRSDTLITDGIYRLTRNPQITGYGILIISFVIIWPSWYWVLSFFAYAIVVHKMVITEEHHLEKRFGDAYRKYRKRTGRYL